MTSDQDPELLQKDINGNGSQLSRLDPEGAVAAAAMSLADQPEVPAVVSPDMLYKLCKKIAQLTKVIYSLNTRNDDLEMDIEQLRSNSSTQEDLDSCENGHTNSDQDTFRKELKQLKLALKAMEDQMSDKNAQLDKVAANEHKMALLDQQVRQYGKEKQELLLKLDRSDLQRENLRMERDTLKRDLTELQQQTDRLQLELSTANIQLKYNKDTVGSQDDFTEELLAKVESLTSSKNALEQERIVSLQNEKQLREQLQAKEQQALRAQMLQKEQQLLQEHLQQKQQQLVLNEQSHAQKLQLLQEAVQSEKEQRALLMDQNAEQNRQWLQDKELLEHLRVEQVKLEREKEVLNDQLQLAQVMRDRLEEELRRGHKEVREESAQTEEPLLQQLEQLRGLADLHKADMEQMHLKLASLQTEKEKAVTSLEEAQKSELELKLESSQKSEKICSLEQRSISLQEEREDLKKKWKEAEAKMEVMAKCSQAERDEQVKQLERALEEALVEREEMLEACHKEIEHEKNIALHTEQKMMDDFEWKLREIEADYREKMRDLNDKKDQDLIQMGIHLQREMDDKLRLERISLKAALDAQHSDEQQSNTHRLQMEQQSQIRALQAQWETERSQLQREIRLLKRQLELLPDQINRAVAVAHAEAEARLQEERSKQQALVVQHQKAKEQLEAEFKAKIQSLEVELDTAQASKTSFMFQMREEVELEFTDRMEQLRNMYLSEIQSQAERLDEDKARFNRLEISLRASLEEQRKELDELNAYSAQREEEHEAKVNELLTRLQEQTTLAVKLQAEIDEYEWYEESEKSGSDVQKPKATDMSGAPKPVELTHEIVEASPTTTASLPSPENAVVSDMVSNETTDQPDPDLHADLDFSSAPDPPPRGSLRRSWNAAEHTESLEENGGSHETGPTVSLTPGIHVDRAPPSPSTSLSPSWPSTTAMPAPLEAEPEETEEMTVKDAVLRKPMSHHLLQAHSRLFRSASGSSSSYTSSSSGTSSPDSNKRSSVASSSSLSTPVKPNISSTSKKSQCIQQ